MNALEAASLVMIPSGYENGTLGSLKPTDGTGDFTFSRGSDISATRVNEDGYIEKGYENLLLQSNSFDTTWATNSSANVTSGQSGYDGTNDAWLLDLDYTGGDSYLRQEKSISGVNTFSIYAKAGTTDGIHIEFAAGDFPKIKVDLSDGSLITTTGTIDTNIQSIGSGWYRVSLSVNQSLARVNIRAVNGSGINTTGTIYIQDAMINQGMVSYPYVETTTAPVAGGILEDMPRLDYSGSCPALLLEPQRTNLVTQSEYLSGYTLTNSSIETNSATSPEGVANATRLIEDTSTGEHRILNPTILTSSGTAYTYSFFVKANGRSKLRFYSFQFNNLTTIFDFVTNNVISTSGGTSPSITSESYGNDWYRVSISDTTTAINLAVNTMLVKDDNSFNYTGDGTSGVYLYGFQVEQDATYPTSYIPTNGTSQTRLVETLADSIDIGSFTSNYNTLFFDWGDMEGKSTFNRDIVRGWATMDNSFPVFRIVSINDGVIRYQVYASAAGSESANYTCTTRDKAALVLNGLNSKLFINGLPVATFSIDVQQGLRKFNYNGLSRNVTNQFTIFPTALSDDECIELTTI